MPSLLDQLATGAQQNPGGNHADTRTAIAQTLPDLRKDAKQQGTTSLFNCPTSTHETPTAEAGSDKADEKPFEIFPGGISIPSIGYG